MTRVLCLLAGLLTTTSAAAAILVQDPAATAAEPQPLPTITGIRIEGATVYAPDELQRRFRLAPGARLPRPLDELSDAIARHYHSDGYSFARATTSIDSGGSLVIAIDEGQIDAIELRGVSGTLAERLREAFALEPGDLFNHRQASRALDAVLEITRGAVERAHAPGRRASDPDSIEVRRHDPFSMIVEGGKRLLLVHLRTRSHRSGAFVGTQGREDWYSPVDGFAPAVGFQSTLFDKVRFNHTYWAGYVSYKFGPERFGYSFGLERPFFRDGVVQAGASIHDLTGSDDRWRLDDTEQSLVAIGFRNTFRDYYRRKGFQLHAALRPLAAHEWLVAWRNESHAPLVNETDWGFFRDDHPFRPNLLAQEGNLRSVIVGYTFDSRGLTPESSGERFRRHLVDDLFGSTTGREHGARVEWLTELAPAAFNDDFDFTRHVLNARGWLQLSPGRMLSARMMSGWTSGEAPPQRVFALGGIGSVHGYGFKEAAGGRMVLLNGEVSQRFGRSGLSGLVFLDAGRVFEPLPGTTDGWLTGVGVGLGFGDTSRVEFGWRLNDIPDSLQVLFRLRPSF